MTVTPQLERDMFLVGQPIVLLVTSARESSLGQSRESDNIPFSAFGVVDRQNLHDISPNLRSMAIILDTLKA